MNKITAIILLISSLVFTFCGNTQTIKNVSAQEFKVLVASGNGIVLDVRTPEEVASGKIENASTLNYYDKDFESKLAFIQKDKPVYVYCKSGGRSSKAAKILTELGQFEVYNLSGGMRAWEKAKLPVVASSVVKDAHIKSLSVAEFDALLKTNKKVLVDFHTQWCVPCRKMVPIINELEESLKDQVFIIRIDLDQSKALTEKYNIASVPTFLLFTDGAEVWRQAGIMSKQELLKQLQ